MPDTQQRLRELPPVGTLLGDERIARLLRGRKQAWMTRLVQQTVADLRGELQEGGGPVKTRAELTETACARILAEHDRLLGPSWRRVLNGTGVVVHTNLGRSNLPPAAAEAARMVAVHNSDLEFDLQAGVRGHRGRRVERKAALLAGAEDALIVNNNAAAVWLAVRHLGRGGRVILSRGEVVAIGGSFRMHEILAETGCQLVEVGTTNRTGLQDYAEAITPGAVVMKVHRSNFTVEGFTQEVPLAELGEVCRAEGAHLVYDAGSGALFPFEQIGLPPGETELHQDVHAGCDLVTCSGDKLLGACQAGIILGSRSLIDGLRAHPMRRAFRVDKTTLAALDAVLSLYLAAEGEPAVPTISLLAQPMTDLTARAERLLAGLAPHAPAGWRGRVAVGRSSVGGGSFSAASVESRLVLFEGPKSELEACHLRLRTGDPALVGRMNQDGLGIDVRTIAEGEEPLVVESFKRAWGAL